MVLLLATGCQVNPYFDADDESLDTTENLLRTQKEADALIEKELANAKNTFDEPLVLENPYRISPLSALIVFQTED